MNGTKTSPDRITYARVNRFPLPAYNVPGQVSREYPMRLRRTHAHERLRGETCNPCLRRNEARRAASILGIDEIEFWDYPDGKLAEVSDLMTRVKALLAADRPDVIYRPSTLEVHPDHRALGVGVEAVLQEYRLACGDFCYEIWATVQPTHVIDIMPIWDVKRQAVEQYESQLRYNDLLHMMTGLNAYRNIFAPWARYVEAFQIG